MRKKFALATAATVIGVIAVPATATAAPDLQSSIPTPANTQRTDGPDPIQENGIHLHFLVNGSPSDVMGAYNTALQGKGWAVTVASSSGGGATYTGSNAGTYGVFTGGGYGNTTDVDACAWPTKPSNTDCGSHR
jgi:hypothetical protein